MAVRYFSLSEAAALLPRLTEMLEALRRIRDQAILKKAQVDLLWQRLGAGEPVLRELGEEQGEMDGLTARLLAVAKDLEAIGCIVRDVALGLVDFPFRIRIGPSRRSPRRSVAPGRDDAVRYATVFLCWRLGEPAIAFWHGADEGYAGRKPIAHLPVDAA